ncbi:hypothetical protein [Streptomyces sp. NBC_01527]|uniref:hypothetical protein n=1 Tax=unclassified Streptomyces TaxID=2593676 RepID=UPI00386E695F
MPRLDGLESIGHLLNLPHPPRILMLTTFHEDESVRVALRATVLALELDGELDLYRGRGEG